VRVAVTSAFHHDTSTRDINWDVYLSSESTLAAINMLMRSHLGLAIFTLIFGRSRAGASGFRKETFQGDRSVTWPRPR